VWLAFVKSKQRRSELAKEQVVEQVNQGATYEANEGGERVVAFFVDRPRNEVRYSTLGSARENRMDIDGFLKGFKLIAQEGEPLPEDKDQKATNTRKADTNISTQSDAGNTTRTAINERTANRNER
jgi:hypothetical protein